MTSYLRNSSDVTKFCYHRVEYIKLNTCAKFLDHQSNHNKVRVGGLVPMTDGSEKKTMSNRVNRCFPEITRLKNPYASEKLLELYLDVSKSD